LHGSFSVIGGWTFWHLALLGVRQSADREIMAVEKTHLYLNLPVELLREIDALAGPRRRSAFIAAAVEQEIRRRKLAALKSEQLEAQEASERLSVN
jgi:hypothetical protein